MSAKEVLSIVSQRSIEISVVLVLGLIDALANAFFPNSGSSRGDDES